MDALAPVPYQTAREPHQPARRSDSDCAFCLPGTYDYQTVIDHDKLHPSILRPTYSPFSASIAARWCLRDGTASAFVCAKGAEDDFVPAVHTCPCDIVFGGTCGGRAGFNR